MSRSKVRLVLSSLAFTAVATLAACSHDLGDAKLKALKADAPRDSVLATMGTGPFVATTAADSMRVVNGFRRQAYIVDGKQYEVLWYREAPGVLEAPIVQTAETPVVIVDNKMVGYGWSFFDTYSEKHHIPNPSKNAARIDSIVRAQNPNKN